MSSRRRPTQKLGWAFAFCATVLRPLLMTLTRRRWQGTEHIPSSGGFVMACNHISHLDPLTCAHFVYDNGRVPRFLTKGEVFDVPVIGRIVRSAGQIPVYRLTRNAEQSFRAAVAEVERGEAVICYPEGTISRDPELWPMVGKSGAARIALTTGCPVIPVAQWGAQEILAPYAKRPRLLPRKTIRMKAGPPVDLDAFQGHPLTPELLRKATDRIMDAITELLADVREEQPPLTRFDPKVAGVRAIGNPKKEARPKRRRKGRA